MIRIGIQSESPAISSRPILKPAHRERRAECDAEQQHREGPDHIQHARQHRVDPAPVVAGQQADNHREHCGDGRRHEADIDRGAPAVHQPHHHVAAVLVGAEQVAPVQPRPNRCAVGRDDVGLLPVDHHLVGDVVLIRPGVRHMVGPQGCRQAKEDDHDEKTPACQRNLVAPQAKPGQIPGATALDLRGRYAGRKRRLAGGLQFADRARPSTSASGPTSPG